MRFQLYYYYLIKVEVHKFAILHLKARESERGHHFFDSLQVEGAATRSSQQVTPGWRLGRVKFSAISLLNYWYLDEVSVNDCGNEGRPSLTSYSEKSYQELPIQSCPCHLNSKCTWAGLSPSQWRIYHGSIVCTKDIQVHRPPWEEISNELWAQMIFGKTTSLTLCWHHNRYCTSPLSDFTILWL